MQQALSAGAGVLRNAQDMQCSISQLEALQNQAQAACSTDGPEGFVRLRLLNDLQTALLVCKGAYEREESCGCHTLTDGHKPAAQPYRVIQSLSGCTREPCNHKEEQRL